MSESVIDEVVATRTGNGPVARANISETIDSTGRRATKERVQSDFQKETSTEGRQLRTSGPTADQVAGVIESHEQGDADEGEDPVAPDITQDGDPDDEGETVEEGDTDEEEVPAPDVWQTKAQKLEEHNRRLVAQLDAAQKTPRQAAGAREQRLLEAERLYVDEGPVAAMRHFLGTVLDAAHDSPAVDAELAGLYTELTAKEIGVPLEQAQQAMREAARTRLALARDKRERKAETAPKAEADSSAIPPEAAQFIEGRLSMARETGSSFADDHPHLMAMSKQLDGMDPGTLVAQIIRREIKAGTLDPAIGDDAMVQAAAKIVENHYRGIAEKFGTVAKKSKSGTVKPEAAKAVTPSKAASQPKAAPKLTNANASAAPAAPPTKKNAPAKQEAPKKFASDKERRDYALRHLPTA